MSDEGGGSPAMSAGQMLASRGIIGDSGGGGGGISGGENGISFDMNSWVQSLMQTMETSTLIKMILPFISVLKAMQSISLEALSSHILGSITPSVGGLKPSAINKMIGFGKGGVGQLIRICIMFLI